MLTNSPPLKCFHH